MHHQGTRCEQRCSTTDACVSRYRAWLERKGSALYITDRKSTNGTILNGRKLEPHVPYQIREGDVISIGNFTLTLRLRELVSTRTEIAASHAVPRRMPGILRSGWFLGVITALIITGIGVTLWHFRLIPFLSPSPIARVKPAVVLIQGSDSFGSGVIISKSGYVLTCSHVVKNDSPIEVTVYDSAQFKGKVIARDERRDLAIIKIDAGGFKLTTATLGDSGKLEVGEELIGIGYPFGLKGGATVSRGIVSAFRESDGVHYIQTDTPFNPGDAGGPLINTEGEVIGIMTAKVQGESVEGMAFAIAINDAKSFLSTYRGDGLVQID